MKLVFAAAFSAASAFALSAAAQEARHTDQSEESRLPPSDKVYNLPEDGRKDDLVKRANFAEAMNDVAERQKVFSGAPERFSLEGSFTQGGLLFGHTEPGATVKLDGDDVMIDNDGRFVLGFGRDAPQTALVVISFPDGSVERRSIDIADREFPVQRIDGIDQSKVSGFTEDQLKKIAADTALKKAARKVTQDLADWSVGFDWPAVGPISGVFGSQRILNGEPKTPHSGVDVAVPAGTPVRAPAPGVVRLAESDMYFEGGLVFIDHGQWLESAFLHLSRIDVQPGQRVEKGDIIGAVGSTGRATGPHLHWSMKWAGTLVDPQLVAGPMPQPGAAPVPEAGN